MEFYLLADFLVKASSGFEKPTWKVMVSVDQVPDHQTAMRKLKPILLLDIRELEPDLNDWRNRQSDSSLFFVVILVAYNGQFRLQQTNSMEHLQMDAGGVHHNIDSKTCSITRTFRILSLVSVDHFGFNFLQVACNSWRPSLMLWRVTWVKSCSIHSSQGEGGVTMVAAENASVLSTGANNLD